MRIAEDAGDGMAEQLLRHPAVGVGVLADRVQSLLTGEADAAGDGEGDHDPITDFEFGDAGSHLDYFAHEFMTKDVAGDHGWYVGLQQVQVRAADRRRRDLHDRVLTVEDLRIRDVFDVYVVWLFPNGRFHDCLLAWTYRRLCGSRCMRSACRVDGPDYAPLSTAWGRGCAGFGPGTMLSSECTISPTSTSCLKRRRSFVILVPKTSARG